jgi:hypothetical protein
MPFPLRLTALTPLFLSGCLLVESVKMVDVPSRPDDCAIRFERRAPDPRTDPFVVVGHLCLWNRIAVLSGEELSETARQTLRPEACRLGGERVAVEGFCPNALGIEYAVMKTREPEWDEPHPRAAE